MPRIFIIAALSITIILGASIYISKCVELLSTIALIPPC